MSWPAKALSEWRPPAPFTADVYYLMGGEDPDPLWLTPVPGVVDRLGRRVFLGYGPSGKPLRPDAMVVGAPSWAVVKVAHVVNGAGVPVYAMSRGLQT
jgi:hypothetical protein